MCPQLFLGTHRSAIVQFSFSPVRSNNPRGLCEVSSPRFPSHFKIANRFSSSDAPSLSRTKSDLHKDPFGAGYISTVGTR